MKQEALIAYLADKMPIIKILDREAALPEAPTADSSCAEL